MAIGPVTPPVGETPVIGGHGGRGALPGDRPEPGRMATAGTAPAATPSILPAASALDAAVAEALGRQDGLAALFALGAALADAPDLPPPLARALAALAGLVVGDAPDGGAVRAGLVRSGLFHEHVMAPVAGPAGLPVPSPVDLKGIVALLAGALRAWLAATGDDGRPGGHPSEAAALRSSAPAADGPRLAPPARTGPPVPQPAVTLAPVVAADPRLIALRLLAETQHAAARLVLHQAASLDEHGGDEPVAMEPAPVAGRPAWSFDLPIAGPTGVSMAALRVEHDGGGDPAGGEAGGRGLKVEIGFAVDPLGPIQARIGLIGADRLVIGLWCERPEAIGPIERETPAFRTAMAAAGLDVMMDVRLGRPPPPGPPPVPAHRLDVRL